MQQLTIVLVLLQGLAAPSRAQGGLSLTMAEAVEKSLATHPRVLAARQRVEAARAELRAARAAAGPQATLALFGAYTTREAMVASPPTSEPDVSATLGKSGAVGAGIGAMVPLFTSGRIAAEIRRSQAMVAQAEAHLARVQAEVAAGTREAYLRVLLARAVVRVAEARRDAARAMAENARALWETGKGIEATYLRAFAEQQDAERDVAMALAEQDKAVIALAASLGLPPETPVTPTDGLTLTKPYPSVEAALADAARGSPELAESRAAVAEAVAAASAARAAQGTQLYGLAMADLEGARGMGLASGATVGLAAAWPLWDGGMRREARRSAESHVLASSKDLRAVELEVAASVRQAWRDLEAAETATRAAEAALRAAKAAYGVVALRVENQKSILVEQLDALTAVRRADEALARSLFEHEMAVVRLLRAAGRVTADTSSPAGGAVLSTERTGKQ